MADPLSVLTHALRDHLRGDAAFAAIEQVREHWPAREHQVPGTIAIVDPVSARSNGAISTGEDAWVYSMRVVFGVRVRDTEEGAVSDVLMAWAHALADDLRTQPGALSSASLPTGSHYQRTIIGTITPTPSPYTDDPTSHAVVVPFDVHTCEERL